MKPVNQWRIGPGNLFKDFKSQAFVQPESNIAASSLEDEGTKIRRIFVPIFSAVVFQFATPFQRQKVSAAECHIRNGAPRFQTFRGLHAKVSMLSRTKHANTL